jgi:citrate lyase subunit beta/citryl-CoA lyase
MDRGPIKPLRTVLFVAGSEENEVLASPDHGADAIVLDIEEPRTPCPESERVKARRIVGDFLRTRKAGEGPLYFVRVQPPASGFTFRDLEAVMCEALAGILLPKAVGPADVHAADALLTALEVELGLARDSKILYPILETADGLRLAYDIAMASPRIKYLGGAVSRFGDIHQAVGFRWSAEGTETLYFRSKVLIDARSAGIRYPISGMWGGRRDDMAGLRKWATHLRDLGYYGMMISDPQHVPLVHEIFSPTADELRYWTELDTLATEAEKAGTGPILHGDPNQGEAHVVHIAHVGSARLNLEWAEALGVR